MIISGGKCIKNLEDYSKLSTGLHRKVHDLSPSVEPTIISAEHVPRFKPQQPIKTYPGIVLIFSKH